MLASSWLRSSVTVRPKLLHAVATHLLGGSQRLLGCVEVAAQHVPGARHLQHDGGQAVTDDVVDVTSDPTPLCEKRLLGQLTTGALELDHQSFLASDRATDDPDENDRHDPDSGGDLHWILDEGHQDGRGRGEQTEHAAAASDRFHRAAANASKQALNMTGSSSPSAAPPPPGRQRRQRRRPAVRCG